MEMIITLTGGAKVEARWREFVVTTDQPVRDGGEGSAPSPFDTFLASLGTCAGYYVLSFCRQRGLPTDGIRLVQTTERDPVTHMVGKLRIEIEVPADFPEKYRPALVRAAEQCAVKKHMEHPPAFEVETVVR